MTFPVSKMHKDSTLLALILALLIVIPNTLGVSRGQLRVGFYSKTCPNAESIIHKVVQKAVSNNPRNAAILLRLHFHDCFVEGCDGSILIRNDVDGELKAKGNLGVLGFNIIESAKAQLENICPGIVSCADIVALAARDAVSLVKGPFYDIPTGRKDGRLSKMSLAGRLPDVDDSISVLKSKFREKGLSDKDLVLLSGAHTIGVTACFFMRNRLYNFTTGGSSDPAINRRILPRLKAKCPINGDVNVRIPLDWSTQNVFDVQILRNIRDGNAVIASDARLYDDKNTKQILDSYISSAGSGTRPSFNADFAKAMVNMGNIGVKTGSKGEIRRLCNAVN
ncbi:peroxidase 43 isoform X2 [Durio zibethinus]|uniref:Peroxidase n=1 Tax=Durio zibethinus TaxID=66656 RepID=A0A6P5ZML1_DURZI|nr:peroxidase 43 isoform X2 [Durio zibethinus]